MTSTAPWWGTSLFTLATGLVTGLIAAFAALAPKRTERKIERRRLSREHKERSYPEITRAAYALTTARLWSTSADNGRALLHDLVAASHEAAFFAPADVITTIHRVLDSATALNSTNDDIRATSKPGHNGAIDRARAAEQSQAVDQVRTALQQFINASRTDLELPGPYNVLIPSPRPHEEIRRA
jgi:hypothetical protein